MVIKVSGISMVRVIMVISIFYVGSSTVSTGFCDGVMKQQATSNTMKRRTINTRAAALVSDRTSCSHSGFLLVE